MCCWIIWSERNKLVWDDGTFNPQFMASSAARMLEEYIKFHPNKTKNKARPAFRVDSGLGGIGVVVSNEFGTCIATLQRSLPFCSSAMHAETEACRDGLKLALQHGWDNFTMETDRLFCSHYCPGQFGG